MARSESAKDAYDSFAAVYDEYTSENNYELWLGKTIFPDDGVLRAFDLVSTVTTGTGVNLLTYRPAASR